MFSSLLVENGDAHAPVLKSFVGDHAPEVAPVSHRNGDHADAHVSEAMKVVEFGLGCRNSGHGSEPARRLNVRQATCEKCI